MRAAHETTAWQLSLDPIVVGVLAAVEVPSYMYKAPFHILLLPSGQPYGSGGKDFPKKSDILRLTEPELGGMPLP